MVAVIWYENALPTFPLAAVELVNTGVAPVMVSVSVPLPVPPLLVALSATVDVPADVGVPDISPVPLFTDKPPGNPVAA